MEEGMAGFAKAYLTRKVSWVTWQFSVLKLSMISFGIILGSYFAGFWKPLMLPLWVVFVVTAVWVSVMWLQQVMVNKSNKKVMKK